MVFSGCLLIAEIFKGNLQQAFWYIFVCKTRMHVFFNRARVRDIWLRGNVAESLFAQMCKCPKRILGLLNRMLVPGDRQSCWQHLGGGAPPSITLLCSFLFFSALLFLEVIFYSAVPYSALFYFALLFSSEPLCQLPANHRLTCKKPPPIEFPGFFLWLAGSPYLASQCLHVRRTWPLYGSFSHRSYISLFGNIAQLCSDAPPI